jgi:uncharacterized protein
MTIKCPICKKPVTLGTPDFPFCSERCRDIDLGAWANEEYRIPSSTPAGQPAPPEEEEED